MVFRRLDRQFQLDWRSLNYPVTAALDPEKRYPPRSYTWRLESVLDQGQEGACVGFAFAHELMASPSKVLGVSNQTARHIYFDAQMVDEWPGGAYPGAEQYYEGTSILAGAKVCTKNGFYDSYSWGFSTLETAKGVGYFGPVTLGTNWYTEMFWPDKNGFIHPLGNLAGGHAILIVGVKIKYKLLTRLAWWKRTWDDVDWNKSYFILHNSWGPEWGIDGRAYLTFTDFEKLLYEDIDICFPSRTRQGT